MQQSSYFPGSSENWDTSWARNYLKISEEQLSKLESIPEWLPVSSLEKTPTVSVEVTACVSQKEPLLQDITLPENLNKDNPILPKKKDICPKVRKQIRNCARMDSDFDISVSYSQPEMGSYKSAPVFPRPLEKLGDNILSHKYLKPPTPTSNKPENGVLSDASQTENPKACETLEETTARPETSEKKTSISCDVEVSKPAEEDESGSTNSREALEVGSVNAVIEENQNDKLDVEPNEEVSNSKMCTSASGVEDSFGIPCGQPVNVVADPSSSPIDSSGEAANKQEIGLEKVDASAVLQTPEKAKDNLLSSPHSVGSSVTNRKRKSNGGTPKHLKNAKRPRNLNIHFTSDQVKHMLEILRLTYSK